MKLFKILCGLTLVVASAYIPATAQTSEMYTGTIVSYGSGRNIRSRTGTFDLRITGETSKSEVESLLSVLETKGQDEFANTIDSRNLGKVSINSSIGPDVNFVMRDQVGDKTRIIAIFKRWIHFGEVRAGGRSHDYPFGVVEMYIDPQTGKGEGTFIGAAKLDWQKNRKTGQMEFEITGFATFPSKLLAIRRTVKAAP